MRLSSYKTRRFSGRRGTAAPSVREAVLRVGLAIPADGRLRPGIRVPDISRIVDTTEAHNAALSARVEIAFRRTAGVEATIAIVVESFSMTRHGTHRDNAQGQAEGREQEGSSHFRSPFQEGIERLEDGSHDLRPRTPGPFARTCAEVAR